jgi:ribonuclease P protein subunit POP4
MNVTPNIIKSDLVGTEAKVVKSAHSDYVGLSGKVVEETRKTFTVMHERKKKTIIKESAIFHFKFSDGTIVEINGKLLTGKPEDRLKKHVRRLW